MFSIKFSNPARKALKRLRKPLLDLLWETYLPNLKSNPLIGEKLKGDLKNFYKLEFTQSGVSYRLAYELLSKEKIILVLYLGTRENFYREFRRKIK